MNRLSILAFLFLIQLVACVPPTQEVITEVKIGLDNPDFQKFYDFQDRRQVDSVLQYTSHPDPAYRYSVANALASIQDPAALDSLSKLLDDPILEVRAAAAYALGQLGDKRASTMLIEAFKRKDTLDVDNALNGNILEAIGKVGDENLLKSIATVSTYRTTDTLLLLNQARAIYRYGLRGITADEGTDQMLAFLTDGQAYPRQVQELAAAYLQRNKSLDLSSHIKRLTQLYNSTKNTYIKMRLASVLSRSADREALPLLLETLADADEDYRTKVEILRSLGSYPYIQVIDQVIACLKGDDLHVAHAAADYLTQHGNPSDAALYKDFIQPDMRYSVKAKIYEAVLRNIPTYYTNTKLKIAQDIQALYDDEQATTYVKAAYLRALGQDPFNYKRVAEMGLESTDPVIRSTAVELLGGILRSPNYVKAFRSGIRRVNQEVLGYLQQFVTQGDVGAMAVAGGILADDDLKLTPLMVDSLAIYREALAGLKLPQHIETYNELNRAISKAAGQPYVEKKVAFNHPIKWATFNNHNDSTIAVIKTNRGNITVQLYATQAPGSVANFIALAQDNYYDAKTVHRVVPNFVIQAGCSRGDGYGGLDYTIRSEYSPLYYDEEGYIGMASAGADTEGTQWFITQSPTPHLDGRYTIFGKVIAGMDVVHAIQVGDMTHDVIISRL